MIQLVNKIISVYENPPCIIDNDMSCYAKYEDGVVWAMIGTAVLLADIPQEKWFCDAVNERHFRAELVGKSWYDCMWYEELIMHLCDGNLLTYNQYCYYHNLPAFKHIFLPKINENNYNELRKLIYA